MNIYIKAFLTCEDTERHDNGRTSFHNIHDRVFVDKLPFVVEDTKLVLYLDVNTEDDKEIEISIEDPDGEDFGDQITLDVLGRDNPYNAYFVLALNMPVEKEGYYTFFAKIDGIIAGFHDLYIELKGGKSDE